MLKVVLHEDKLIPPFCEPARELRIQNKPLWLIQRDVLAKYTTREVELMKKGDRLPATREETIVYRDNLFFDQYYIDAFIEKAQQLKRPVRAAFRTDEPAFREHAFPLSISYTPAGSVYLADLWYYPNGPVADVEPLAVDMLTKEHGYYHVPTYMAETSGDLIFQVPLRAMMAIDSWVHVFIADTVFGQFATGARFERLGEGLAFKLKLMGKAIYEGRQVLECSELVKIGKNCTVDPSAVIKGPTTIGDNVTVNAGAVIDNCLIGNNVNVGQGVQLMLSVVGDGTFLPFRAALFMTTMMDHSMLAQNTCLQMCVVGKNTFIGAGSTWTDYNLIPIDIRARDGAGELRIANRAVLGGCVGHNCRIGAGMIVYPARTIESDVVLATTKERRVIDRDIKYEDSDHLKYKPEVAEKHKSLYHKKSEELESW